MFYCPRRFVLNTLGITALAVIAASLLQALLGLERLILSFALMAPAAGGALEGASAARALGRPPLGQDMWHAAYQLASIYVHMFFIAVITLVVAFIDHATPDFLSAHGLLGMLIFATSFMGMMTLGVRFGYWLGAQHASKGLRT